MASGFCFLGDYEVELRAVEAVKFESERILKEPRLAA